MNKKAFIELLHHSGNLQIDIHNASFSADNDLIVLVTAAGQISGTILKNDSSDATEERITDNLFLAIKNSYIENSKELDFILLKNAVLLLNSGKEVRYRYLYVFTDDVIAATVANSESN